MAAQGNRRKTGLEQYYTPPALARQLLDETLAASTAALGDTWIEPAAGTGSFVHAMQAAGISDVVSMDIDPKLDEVEKRDFLTSTLDVTDAVCLTNPPFGRNHSLSVPFFNHAAEHCKLIAFVVPRSWRKWSIVNRLDPRFHKISDRDLEVSYVDEHGEPLSGSSVLNTIFQIWERSDQPRPRLPGDTPTYFNKVNPEIATGSITIFGRGCGTVKTTFPRVSNTTQMFVDASPEILTALAAVDLSPFFSQVAYTEALSLVEINYALHHWLSTGQQLAPDFLRHSPPTR